MALPDARHTEKTLILLRAIYEMTPSFRSLLSRWLEAHGVRPASLDVEHPIVRDPYKGSLEWHERDEKGASVRRLRYAGKQGTWPAPFPTVASAPHEAEGGN